MINDVCYGASNMQAKRIKLEKDFISNTKENDTRDRRKMVKLEPRLINICGINSNSQQQQQLQQQNSEDQSEIRLKVIPVLSISDKSNSVSTITPLTSSNTSISQSKPIQFYIPQITSSAKETDSSGSNSLNTESTRYSCNSDSINSNLRPSEGLFVRCLLPYCKRLAPLWFKGVSSMREKNREEHRRISASAACQNQNDWDRISNFINDMTSSVETDTVVNLLKKLYKELPADSVLWFIKCWLNFPEALKNETKCAFSRGDVRGRMRRIDGGKGSDKVWRLDTIVGMMYHGMPMSSTDTNIMVHTCDQELCIRPQHLRFKASSVALVVVLKALQQTGYSIVPPQHEEQRCSPIDEYVDVSGPFNIEQLQQYRTEHLIPCERSMGKLNNSSTDVNLLETYPLLKDFYPSYSEELQYALSSHTSNRFGFYYNQNVQNFDLRRPAQTRSNSTGSPPNLVDSNVPAQCHSPPQIIGQPKTNEIAPTPRKLDSLIAQQQQICKGVNNKNISSSSNNSNNNDNSSNITAANDDDEDDEDNDDDDNDDDDNDDDNDDDDDDDDDEMCISSTVNNIKSSPINTKRNFSDGDADYGSAASVAPPELLPEEPFLTVIPNLESASNSVSGSVSGSGGGGGGGGCSIGPVTLAAACGTTDQHGRCSNSSSSCTNGGGVGVGGGSGRGSALAGSNSGGAGSSVAGNGRPWSNIDSPIMMQQSPYGIICSNSCGGGGGASSGKNTPRQPAKKRLEARTPTFMGCGIDDDLMSGSGLDSVDSVPPNITTVTTSQSQLSSSGSRAGSAFKKYLNTHCCKTPDPESESEISDIFDSTHKHHHRSVIPSNITSEETNVIGSSNRTIGVETKPSLQAVSDVAATNLQHQHHHQPQQQQHQLQQQQQHNNQKSGISVTNETGLSNVFVSASTSSHILSPNAGGRASGISEPVIDRGSCMYKKMEHDLTTPSPLDYLLMAISSQTPNFICPDEPMTTAGQNQNHNNNSHTSGSSNSNNNSNNTCVNHSIVGGLNDINCTNDHNNMEVHVSPAAVTDDKSPRERYLPVFCSATATPSTSSLTSFTTRMTTTTTTTTTSSLLSTRPSVTRPHQKPSSSITTAATTQSSFMRHNIGSNVNNVSSRNNHHQNRNTSTKSSISCRFTPEQATVLLNVMRSSPLGNNNPEIIDILYNMTQQYGFHPPCSNSNQAFSPDNVLLKKHIYQQLKSSQDQHDLINSSSPTKTSATILGGISSGDTLSIEEMLLQASSPYDDNISETHVSTSSESLILPKTESTNSLTSLTNSNRHSNTNNTK